MVSDTRLERERERERGGGERIHPICRKTRGDGFWKFINNEVHCRSIKGLFGSKDSQFLIGIL
jgi:hypothetical protein